MDKRVVMAAGLSVLVLLIWGFLFPPPKPPDRIADPETILAEERSDEAGPDAEPDEPEPEPEPAEPAAEAGTAVAAERAERFRVTTDLFDVELTNEGARVLSWKLLEYTTSDGSPLELLPRFEGAESRTLAFTLDDDDLAEQLLKERFAHRTERLPATGGRAAGERVTFEWADGFGRSARKVLEFREGSYLVDVAVEVTDRGRRLGSGVAFGPGFGAQDPGQEQSNYHYEGQALWNRDGTVRRVKPKKVVAEPGGVSGELTWVGLEDQYFAALVVPGEGETDVRWRPVELARSPLPDGTVPEAGPEPVLSIELPDRSALIYVGPKKFTLLREIGFDLQKAVWFATNPFLAWIARHIFLGLIWIHDHTYPNYGLAIILSTFLLRLLLFPVNQYSMVSMKKTQLQMQRLQPKIKAIRSKYKKSKDIESRNKMNQEMMELYRREGVNPAGGLSGCLPLLAQFPILIAFYNMLTVAIELRGAEFFGWIHDLSQKDPFWVIPLAMGGTMFLQQKMALSKVKDPMQQQQQRIMMFMPVVFTWICLQMPAGMVLYWFVNNVLGIGQQWLVNRHTARLEAAAQKA